MNFVDVFLTDLGSFFDSLLAYLVSVVALFESAVTQFLAALGA